MSTHSDYHADGASGQPGDGAHEPTDSPHDSIGQSVADTDSCSSDWNEPSLIYEPSKIFAVEKGHFAFTMARSTCGDSESVEGSYRGVGVSLGFIDPDQSGPQPMRLSEIDIFVFTPIAKLLQAAPGVGKGGAEMTEVAMKAIGVDLGIRNAIGYDFSNESIKAFVGLEATHLEGILVPEGVPRFGTAVAVGVDPVDVARGLWADFEALYLEAVRQIYGTSIDPFTGDR